MPAHVRHAYAHKRMHARSIASNLWATGAWDPAAVQRGCAGTASVAPHLLRCARLPLLQLQHLGVRRSHLLSVPLLQGEEPLERAGDAARELL